MQTKRTSLPVGTTVQVYQDHPAWDQYSAWFMLPARLLNELYICTYKLASDPDDPDVPIHPSRDLDWIEAQHPGCVFVY